MELFLVFIKKFDLGFIYFVKLDTFFVKIFLIYCCGSYGNLRILKCSRVECDKVSRSTCKPETKKLKPQEFDG